MHGRTPRLKRCAHVGVATRNGTSLVAPRRQRAKGLCTRARQLHRRPHHIFRADDGSRAYGIECHSLIDFFECWNRKLSYAWHPRGPRPMSSVPPVPRWRFTDLRSALRMPFGTHLPSQLLYGYALLYGTRASSDTGQRRAEEETSRAKQSGSALGLSPLGSCYGACMLVVPCYLLDWLPYLICSSPHEW